MFRQLLTPVGDSLGLSFLIAILPVVAVLVLLGLLRRPAWQAALAGLVVALIVAVSAWHMPIGLALDSVLNGAVFALWPVTANQAWRMVSPTQLNACPRI